MVDIQLKLQMKLGTLNNSKNVDEKLFQQIPKTPIKLDVVKETSEESLEESLQKVSNVSACKGST